MQAGESKDRGSQGRRPSRAEAWVSLLVVTGLLVIAGALLLSQARFDMAWHTPPVPAGASPKLSPEEKGDLKASDPVGPAPAGYKAANTPEFFNSEDLYLKINGKAGLYHSAGFESLRCQRFHRETTHDDGFEVCAYQMRDANAAFAVYSSQRRKGAEESDVAPKAYRSVNALFFTSGALYVEIISGDFEGQLADVLASFARQMVASSAPAAAEDSAAAPPFPPEGLVQGSLKLHASDAFSFSRLSGIYAAEYQVGDGSVTAFLSKRDSPAAASSLARAYVAFLLENGGRQVETKLAIPTAQAIEILDSYELVFSRGSWLAGVHMSEDLVVGLQLADRLNSSLGEKP